MHSFRWANYNLIVKVRINEMINLTTIANVSSFRYTLYFIIILNLKEKIYSWPDKN